MKVDNSYERYIKTGNDRYEYSVSHLFGSVLDVGCGDGYGIYLMFKNKEIADVIGIDTQIEAVERAIINIPGAKVMIGNAADMPFPGETFDSVHCGQTLEHVEDMEKVLSEIKRVVKSKVVLSVPIKGGLSDQHVKEFKSVEEFRDLISKYFRVLSIKVFREKYKRVVIVAEK